jgi:LuxR family maltose regulon positive regulatory protein
MTKLHPPPARDHIVGRDRLVEGLRARPGTRLTLVAAPAGAGKTTVLAAWRAAETKPIGWVSLGDGDNDPVVLWAYVLAALRSACPGIEVSSSPEIVGASRLVESFLPDLINQLAAYGDAGLVLDDFHRVTSGPARESVAWFIDHAPSTFQLVLATRSEPAVPLTALRARGELVELRAADLEFTAPEAATLLNDRLDLALETEDVDDLVERTEGWAAGLYLAALSLRVVEDRHAFVSRYGGRSRHVVDFLVADVLEAHDAETKSLMLRSSILERLSGRLCDAVLEQEGSAGLLEALSRSNLFLTPLDDHGEWYRFHHLFAQLLRVELEYREPGLAATLHERAYRWCRDNGSVEEAIDHAFAANLLAEASELIATRWVGFITAKREATVLAWIERFPPQAVTGDAQLLLVKAWVLSLMGELAAASDAINAVERLGLLDVGPLPDGFRSVEASLCTLRGTISWGDLGSALRHIRRAAELEPAESRWRPFVCWSLGSKLYYAGELDESDRWLEEALHGARRNHDELVVYEALAFRSFIAGHQGRLDDQLLMAEETMRLSRERADFTHTWEPNLAMGAALAGRGQLEEALPLVERAVEMARARGHPMPIVHASIEYASLLRALDRQGEASQAVVEARAIVDASPDPGDMATRLAAVGRPGRARTRKSTQELSEREVGILRMLTGGLSERELGRELYLSHNTIHSHAKSIYRKLGVTSRSEAIRRARELGLV